MTGTILRKNVGIAVLLALLTIPGASVNLARAQQRTNQDTDNDDSDQETPATPQAPGQGAQPAGPPARPPVGVPGQPGTTGRAVARGDMVSLNFNRADLIEVIHVLAQHLRITYTIDPDVKGTVTINSAEPLRKEDLFPIFHQILRMNNAVAIKTADNMYRIAPIERGKGLARPAAPDDREGGYTLQIIPLRFFSVAEMKRLITPFLTPGGEVFDFPRGNFLMIVDLPSNVQRLKDITDMIDVQTFVGTRMEVYQPKVASADDLAADMTKIMQAYASSTAQAEGFAAQFLSIPRINQLLVIADSEAAWSYVRRWLDRLDTIGESAGRKIYIYPVENGKAADLADVLTAVLGITTGQRRDRGPTLDQLHRGTSSTQTPPTPGLQRSPSTGGFGNFGGSSGSIMAVAPAQQQPQPNAPAATTQPPRQATPPGARPGGPGTADNRPADEQRIVADTTTNSLIIFGTAQEYQNIRNILKDLDQMPRQVVLECLIAEVAMTGNNSLGFDYQILRGGTKQGASNQFTDTFSPTKDSPMPFQFGGTAGIAALVGSNTIRSLITAIQSNDRSKILASPTILATDNQPARIQVGDEVPVATGTIDTGTGGSGISTATAIQSRNTGKILTVIPQVNAKGLVNLQIKVEVSKQGGSVTVGNGGSFPSFSTRDVETTAVVKDGESLMIGGIFSEDRDNNRTGVPYLMDIPVLGWFFRKTTETLTERTELIIIITPRVIRNQDESRAVTDDFRRRLSTVSGEIEKMRRGPAKDDLPPPKIVPEPESRIAPNMAPQNNAATGADEGAAAPSGISARMGPQQNPTKSVWKYLTFGLF